MGRSQSNWFIECFPPQLLKEHLTVQGRTTSHEFVEEMRDADRIGHPPETCHGNRPHFGCRMEGTTPFQTAAGSC